MKYFFFKSTDTKSNNLVTKAHEVQSVVILKKSDYCRFLILFLPSISKKVKRKFQIQVRNTLNLPFLSFLWTIIQNVSLFSTRQYLVSTSYQKYINLTSISVLWSLSLILQFLKYHASTIFFRIKVISLINFTLKTLFTSFQKSKTLIFQINLF